MCIRDREISDPTGEEYGGTVQGMGLLDTKTVFRPEKHRTRAVSYTHLKDREEYQAWLDSGGIPSVPPLPEMQSFHRNPAMPRCV